MNEILSTNPRKAGAITTKNIASTEKINPTNRAVRFESDRLLGLGVQVQTQTELRSGPAEGHRLGIARWIAVS